jgi:hypothetical protein
MMSKFVLASLIQNGSPAAIRTAAMQCNSRAQRESLLALAQQREAKAA